MRIDLDKNEIKKILEEKFGKADFRIFYTESDKCWEERNDKKIKDLERPPEKESYLLYID